ncbi:MAG: squalene--hopene cyclase [Deltaproteobacteria bacterium]|nr:squalene--hopene cyclase [Deltaproteobacteria bacterium]
MNLNHHETYPVRSDFDKKLEGAIARAKDALLALQHPDGYWCFELEADCTIPAEYILLTHFLGEVDEDIEAKIAAYLRSKQCEDGGWNLFHGGDSELSCSVKVYYALKLAGDSVNAPHMVKAREWVLAQGGASRANVFTHYSLALFGQIPWTDVPFLPVEIMLLPRWFPFHFNKVSYWARTVMIPLTILYSLKPRARNLKRIHIPELFTDRPQETKERFPARSWLNRLFLLFDRTGRRLEPLIPGWMRRRALKKAEEWLVEHLNGTHGLGAIFPAMVNALEALACLGYPKDHPYRVSAKKAIDNLLVIGEKTAYCQPCVSPVWDSVWSSLAIFEADKGSALRHFFRTLDWLNARQVLNGDGDWRKDRPALKSGGYAFQFRNEHYPDLDDTAVVTYAMHLANHERYRESMRLASDWVCGMQSKNGGFAAFDADNAHYYLNEVPFADHGALLDPPTSDVSARCAILLSLNCRQAQEPVLKDCLKYLIKEQEPDGSWFGRWGTNYIYGTWSVLDALEKVGHGPDQPHIRKAVAWLKKMQRPDGGWGESCYTYWDSRSGKEDCESTSFQTAWAILGLMAAGEVESPEVRRGAEYLIRAQQSNGLWKDDAFTAPGFPRVFFLKYHGYDKYFPLWALARFRNLRHRGMA